MNDVLTILDCIKQEAPLVQCITNFVTVNDCANIILAVGGSPSMSQDIREVKESVCHADALVCNMGAIQYVDSMIVAGKQANLLQKPVILDPVAAGRTTLRNDLVKQLTQEVHFDVIRGNASEINFLAGKACSGSGVDVSEQDMISKDNLSTMIDTISTLSKQTGSVIVVSGVVDLISNGKQTIALHNGCEMMARITGSGCMLTALIGAFCGAMPEKTFEATVCAVACMGIAGELADQKRIKNHTGNASFRTDLIDCVFNMSVKQLQEGIRYEIYER